MKTKSVYAIGLMSGTSLDGLDLVYVKFEQDADYHFEILSAETVPYSKKWRETLSQAIDLSDEQLIDLDIEYAVFLAEKTKAFISRNKIPKIDFIASHGHTIFHQPAIGKTLQIGNGQVLATRTQQRVVCDFRTQDVSFGGQGAPLVPIGDALLFGVYEACLNLGGFANISFRENDQRIAFDICPVNIVLNYYANKLGFDFDKGGEMASRGVVNTKLLQVLNDLDFYKKQAPKSLGLEWVQEKVFPLIDRCELEIPSILRTFTEHIADQIAKKLQNKKDVLITGGGAFNQFLIARLKAKTKTEICLPYANTINFKEALIFAFLGWLRIDNQINCLKSVTGAKKDHSTGVLFVP